MRCLRHGAWEEEDNSLPNYEYAAREIAKRLKHERLLSVLPRIHSVLIFTGSAPVSFVDGDPAQPRPRDGVGACHIERFPWLLAAFRAASPAPVHLDSSQSSILAHALLSQIKAPAKPRLKRIDDYRMLAEHHTDPFLDCKVYLGEGEHFNEPVWIKEYEQVLAAPEQRNKREQLIATSRKGIDNVI